MNKVVKLTEYKSKLDDFIKEGHLLMMSLPSEKNRKMNEALTTLTKAKHTIEDIIND